MWLFIAGKECSLAPGLFGIARYENDIASHELAFAQYEILIAQSESLIARP
jgi:hypothetical protein